MKFIRSNTRKEETIVWVVLYPAGSQVVQHQRGAEPPFLGSVVKALVNVAVPLEGSEGESFSFCSSPCPNPDRSEDAQHRFILGEGKNRQGAAGCAGKNLAAGWIWRGSFRLGEQNVDGAGGAAPCWARSSQGGWGGPMVGSYRVTSCQKPAKPLSTQQGAQNISEGCRGEGKAASPRIPWHQWLGGCVDNGTGSVCSALICPWA